MKRVRLGIWIYPHGAGGVEHFLSRLFVLLRRTGFESLCFTVSTGSGTRFFKEQGFEVHVLKKKVTIGQLARFFSSRSLDIVMTTLYEPTAARASFLAGIPHLWRCGSLIRVAGKSLSPEMRRRTLHLMGLLSDAVVANSKAVAGQFDAVCREKVVQIPNGLPLERARRYPATDLRRRFSWRGTDRIVAMAAHYYPVKRHEDFIRAAAKIAMRHPECRFVIFGGVFSGVAGGEMKRYAARLFRLRATRGLEKKLVFVQGMDDLGGVLRQAELVVHPCPDESFPNAVLEAMAAGKPILAAAGGGCSELLEHGRTGILVPPRRPDLLASAIDRLLADPEKALRLGGAARREVMKRYDIRTVARRYERLIRGVLSGARRFANSP